MSEAKSGAGSAANGSRRLADAVRAAKIAAAHRSDVVVDIREADRARLDILAEELQPVIEQVPLEDDFFDLAVAGGTQPRFWVDGTAHVTMARDRRTYRFLRETRLGRVVIAESGDVREIADRVTDYIAERIVERDRALAVAEAPVREPGESTPAAAATTQPALQAPAQRSSGGIAQALSWLVLGMLVGAGGLIALAVYRGVPII